MASVRRPSPLGFRLVVLWAVVACGPTMAPGPARPAAPGPAPASEPSAAAAPVRPALATTPSVSLKVGYLPLADWAPLFLAQERGYFEEVGLAVETASFGNYPAQVPLIAQGQLHVAGCASAVICYNAFGRGLDLRIVTDLRSAGQTEKSRGSGALVVRKDLWDNGTIREAHDLIGRTLYTQAGVGSGQQAWAGHWLMRHGVDPAAMDWPQLQFPDLFAAMQNQGAEVGFQSEPFITAGLTRGVHRVLATTDEMEPGLQQAYVMYWTGIDGLEPQAGERFMVAWLRAGRDFINAMEYGTDQEAVIDVLTRETGIKDPEVHRQSKYPWHNPNGEINREALQTDADFFTQLGLMPPTDISPAFDDRYRQFAVSYLGEYQPPQ